MWPFDRNNFQMYQQYAQGYDTGNYNYFNPGQAINHLSQFILGAPPQMQQGIFQQHFEQMPYEHRVLFAQQLPPEYGVDPNNPWSMSQGLMRLGQERPDLLQRIFSHPVLLGGALALTGLVAKHIIEHHRREENAEYQQYADQQYYQNQQYGNPYYQNQGGFQDQQYYMQDEIARERREERELRNELRREEREFERLEEREEHHHHHHHHDEY
jgi:hypothetical protein